jgi:hypothetical protein
MAHARHVEGERGLRPNGLDGRSSISRRCIIVAASQSPPRLMEIGLMKYYDEQETRDLREAVEAGVMGWPLVTSRKMFGCPCYKARDKMFLFLVTRGVVFLNLSDADRETLTQEFAGVPFDTGGRQMKGWVQAPVKDPAGLEPLWPYVERSYQGAIAKADAE